VVLLREWMDSGFICSGSEGVRIGIVRYEMLGGLMGDRGYSLYVTKAEVYVRHRMLEKNRKQLSGKEWVGCVVSLWGDGIIINGGRGGK